MTASSAIQSRLRRMSAQGAGALRRIVIANRHPRLQLQSRKVKHLFHVLDANHLAIGVASEWLPRGELSLVFLTDAVLAKLHAKFLDDPTTTDVITFEGESAPDLPEEIATAGEICVSVDTAHAYSRAHRSEFSVELTLYLVHGWLHLCGYDDLVPAKKRAMRRAEARALAALRTAKAIPHFTIRARGKKITR